MPSLQSAVGSARLCFGICVGQEVGASSRPTPQCNGRLVVSYVTCIRDGLLRASFFERYFHRMSLPPTRAAVALSWVQPYGELQFRTRSRCCSHLRRNAEYMSSLAFSSPVVAQTASVTIRMYIMEGRSSCSDQLFCLVKAFVAARVTIGAKGVSIVTGPWLQTYPGSYQAL
jgi:hypothetical protein